MTAPDPKAPGWSLADAQAWLAWAEDHHQRSCECAGCMRARRLVAQFDRLRRRRRTVRR